PGRQVHDPLQHQLPVVAAHLATHHRLDGLLLLRDLQDLGVDVRDELGGLGQVPDQAVLGRGDRRQLLHLGAEILGRVGRDALGDLSPLRASRGEQGERGCESPVLHAMSPFEDGMGGTALPRVPRTQNPCETGTYCDSTPRRRYNVVSHTQPRSEAPRGPVSLTVPAISAVYWGPFDPWSRPPGTRQAGPTRILTPPRYLWRALPARGSSRSSWRWRPPFPRRRSRAVSRAR